MHLHVQWTISSHGCQWYDSFEPHSRGWKRVSAPTYNSWIFGTHTFDASTLQLQLSVRKHIKTDLQFQVDDVLKQENGFNLVQCPEARARDIKDIQRWRRNKNDRPQVSSVNGLLQASPIIKIFKIKTWLLLRGYPSSGSTIPQFGYFPQFQLGNKT